ncbi:MAG: hypothetical protein ISS26_03335 [Candidatus Omnitrophica bacterium]|nr:hypothetical protein [Candidatus Omnitrophota bacterium]
MTKKIFISFIAVLTIASCLTIPPEAEAKDKKKRAVLSTVDINEDYDILGLVSYRSNDLDPEKIHSALRKKAEKMGADHVLGIRYYSNAGYVYGTGTAVKLKEDK